MPDDDNAAGGHPLAVISYGFWKRRLGLDPSVVGKTLVIRQTVFTIIGVAPPGFFGDTVGESPDMWLPLTMADQLENDSVVNAGGTFWLEILGRLKPGIGPARAAAAMSVLLKQVNAETMGPKAGRMEVQAMVKPASRGLEALRQRFSRPLQVLMGVVGLGVCRK
jgi:hypothetical protein